MALGIDEYHRSNATRTLPVIPSSHALDLTNELLGSSGAQEREQVGQKLVAIFCAQIGVEEPILLVIDAPRPHRLRAGRVTYERLGAYSPRTKTMRLHNRTARRCQVVAPLTFLETLIHGLVHHLDMSHLRLSHSLHTSGFYHRLGHLKRLLRPTPTAQA